MKAGIYSRDSHRLRLSMELHGSYRLVKDYPISRLWGDVIFGPQVEGTTPLLKVLGAGILLNN